MKRKELQEIIDKTEKRLSERINCLEKKILDILTNHIPSLLQRVAGAETDQKANRTLWGILIVALLSLVASIILKLV